MSDILKGNVPELENDATSAPTVPQPPELDDEEEAVIKQLQKQHVHVIIDRGAGIQPIVGLLYSVLFDARPELEFRVSLDQALGLGKALSLDDVFTEFQQIILQHGDKDAVIVRGPFKVKAARLQEIDPTAQTCVLHCLLERHQVEVL